MTFSNLKICRVFSVLSFLILFLYFLFSMLSDLFFFFLTNSWILSLSVPMLLFGTSIKFSKLVGDHGILINSFSYHLFLIDGVPAFHI